MPFYFRLFGCADAGCAYTFSPTSSDELFAWIFAVYFVFSRGTVG
ncbi:hypothetical protein [Microbacterium sp. Bi128]|nr:hypothetical protein [Microbacterium sp. Bi128]CAH0271739.1 hypothetical protein SRABI128_03411 [Microbacterium sp. Bi128]